MTIFTKLWRVAVPAVLAAALTLAVLATFANTAKAADPQWTHHGCRYDPDSISPISYRFYAVDDRYETAFKAAEAKWDTTAAPGHFQEQDWTDDPEIDVLDGFYAGSWNGIMRGSCPSNTGLWTRDEVEIEFNRRLMDNHGSVSKKNTAMHEIGHAYGLSHVSAGCRLMREDRITINTCGLPMPTSDDVDGVTARYP